MKNKTAHHYTVLPNPVQHTCWDHPDWEGVMMDGCAGCDEAEAHQCRFCGYGAVFTTHSDEAHRENGDFLVPDDASDDWTDAPHIYISKENN